MRALTFQAERTLKDLADKVSAEDRAEAENKIEALRESLKGNDIDSIKRGAEELAAVLQRVGTAAYQASASSAGATDGAGADGADADGTGAEAPEGEEAVEGEFKEV